MIDLNANFTTLKNDRTGYYDYQLSKADESLVTKF